METKEEKKIEEYMKKIEEELSGHSDEKKIEILKRKTRYWYSAARDWCGIYEERGIKDEQTGI